MATMYMRVTTDEYELPIYTAMSVQELAQKCKVKPQSIKEYLSRYYNGKVKNCPYRKVDVGNYD